MPQQIQISDEIFARMQVLAIPLVDTPESIIERALAALEREEGGPLPSDDNTAVHPFNPAAPPSLSHTTPKSMTLNGIKLAKSETYWNSLMIAVIREAGRKIGSPNDLHNMLIVNSVIGQKNDNGYKYLSDVEISVQGQDANGAWRQTYELARKLNFEVEVVFTWQAVEKAAMPNTTGRFSIGRSTTPPEYDL